MNTGGSIEMIGTTGIGKSAARGSMIGIMKTGICENTRRDEKNENTGIEIKLAADRW